MKRQFNIKIIIWFIWLRSRRIVRQNLILLLISQWFEFAISLITRNKNLNILHKKNGWLESNSWALFGAWTVQFIIALLFSSESSLYESASLVKLLQAQVMPDLINIYEFLKKANKRTLCFVNWFLLFRAPVCLIIFLNYYLG